jgi:diguanylate cyclase (GGDEF)-like protein
VLGGAVERMRSRRHGDRVAVLLCSSWHSVGPALVIGLVDPGPPSWSSVPVYCAAVLSQFLFDAAAVLIRHRLGRQAPSSQLLVPLGWVAVVDGALAPVAFVIAIVAVDSAAVVLCVLPLGGLLYVLSAERRRRIDESLVLGRAVKDASRAARSDPLTGTGNRLAWQEAVAAAARELEQHGRAASVLLVDLDRLKETNDKHGHDTGDRLIQALAEALQRVVPEEAELARIGGDEFAVLAVGFDETGCEEIVVRLRDELERLDVGGIPVSASVGASSCPPSASLDEALRLADARLYADKARTANGP